MTKAWVILWFICGRVAWGQELLSPGTVFTVCSEPSAMAVGDLNNDGTLDIIVAGKSQDNNQGVLSIFYGKGDGSFSDPNNLTTDKFPVDVQIADVDRDGLDDIIAIHSPSQTTTVLINETHGQFKEKDNFKTKSDPSASGLGDFNKDGILDLIIASASTKELHLYKGNGKGQFKYGGSLLLESNPSRIRVNDFAESGIAHVLVKPDQSSTVMLVVPSEKGSNKWDFSSATFDMRTNPLLARIGDMDGDGKEDAVVLKDGEIQIIFSENEGLFLDKIYSLKAPFAVAAWAIGDFNRDGKNDVAVLDPNTMVIGIYTNNSGTTAAKPDYKKVAVIYDNDFSKPNTADVGILSSYKHVSMELFDNEGKLIRKYFEFDSDLPEGQFALEWNGTDENDIPVSDGQYVFYYKLGSLVITRTVKK
ncbi:FG-GAP-like repeat-containing protein [bacterium]|nr:FG-GAP-like repeat-containing protein [bacterium]